MKFIDLQKQYQRISDKLDQRIKNVFEHSQYILGNEVLELEQKLAEYTGATSCITVANGTDALQIALMALDIQVGDEVIVPAFTFIAPAEMVALLGATPIFVDIDPKTYLLDPNLLEAAVTKKTKAIISVDLYGQCVDYDRINAIAKQHGIPHIADCAQSFGATYKEQKAGNQALISCTSFFPSKPLGCYGDGGACFTSDANLAQKMQEIRNHGQNSRYYHTRIGLNSRLDTIQAAVLLEKLMIFPEELLLRQTVAKKYMEVLEGMVKLPHIESYNQSTYAQFTIEVEHRDQLIRDFQEVGIPTAVHYPLPLHQQPVFHKEQQFFPVAERASQHVLSLPFHPYLTEDEIHKIAKLLS